MTRKAPPKKQKCNQRPWWRGFVTALLARTLAGLLFRWLADHFDPRNLH